MEQKGRVSCGLITNKGKCGTNNYYCGGCNQIFKQKTEYVKRKQRIIKENRNYWKLKGIQSQKAKEKEAKDRLKEWLISPDTEPQGDIEVKCVVDRIDKIFKEVLEIE
jgi:bisphosphoglycerate-dependent phosphoglycerate mutase